jgi:hypothetical protein
LDAAGGIAHHGSFCNPIDAANSAFVVGHVLLELPVECVAAFLQGAGQNRKPDRNRLISVRERDAALECPINQQDHLGERIAVRHIVMLPDPHPRAIIASAFVVENFDEHQGSFNHWSEGFGAEHHLAVIDWP